MDITDLLEHASHHHGLVRSDHATALGISRERLDRLRDRGLLRFEGHNVYRVTGSQSTWLQRVLRGVWATGCAARASHRTAAALWGLREGRSLEVIVPKGVGAHTSHARVHETRHLRGVDVDVRHGIPVTSIERTLVDLAAVLPMGVLARALDDAHAQELTTFVAVEQRLCAMPTKGRRGVGVLRVLLEERIGSPKEEKNPFEEMMRRILASSDLPTPERQEMVEAGTNRYYIDFAYPEFMVAIECDGLLGHGSPAAQAYDLERQNAIIEAGWNIRRFPYSAVRLDPAQTLETIRRAMITNGWTPDPRN